MSQHMPSADDDLLGRVRSTLAERLGDEVFTIPADVPLPDVLERYDSLAALECVTKIEQTFGVEVDFVAHDVRYWFATIGRIAQFTGDQLEDQRVMGGRT